MCIMKLIRVVLLSAITIVMLLGCPVVDNSIHISYEGNLSSGGTPPTDSHSYNEGDEITVLGNIGFLIKPGFIFDGWNTQSNGNGSTYVADDTLTIGAQNTTLYAQWRAIDAIKAVAVGSGFTYILREDGSLWTTGINGAGQLGNGSTDAEYVATKIMDGVKAISAGQQFAMILKDNGDLYGTGDNSDGQLGLGDYVNRSTPTFVKANIASIDCGTFYTMAIDTDGDLWATGSNGISGVLGNNSEDDQLTFIKIDIPDNKEVATVSAGERHTLFVTADGKLYGMGDRTGGVLILPIGSGTDWEENTYLRVPTLLSDALPAIRSISAGKNHSLVVTTNNELYSFGLQNYGSLGNGVHDFGIALFTPYKVTDSLLLNNNINAVQKAIAGVNNTLILKTDGTLLAVGTDYNHNLGDGDNSTAHHLAIFEIDTDVIAADTNGSHTVYATTEGTVWGAGYNNGTLLNGSALGQGVPSSEEYESFVSIPLEEND